MVAWQLDVILLEDLEQVLALLQRRISTFSVSASSCLLQPAAARNMRIAVRSSPPDSRVLLQNHQSIFFGFGA
jgi:hypothetical protein